MLSILISEVGFIALILYYIHSYISYILLYIL
jgi:hypothetical protein